METSSKIDCCCFVSSCKWLCCWIKRSKLSMVYSKLNTDNPTMRHTVHTVHVHRIWMHLRCSIWDDHASINSESEFQMAQFVLKRKPSSVDVGTKVVTVTNDVRPSVVVISAVLNFIKIYWQLIKIQWNYHLQAVCCSKFMTLASLLAGAPWAVKNKYKVFKLINFMFVHEKLNSKWMKLESEEEFLFLTTTKCKLRIRMNYLQ